MDNQSLLSKEERSALRQQEMLRRLKSSESQKARNILAQASNQFQAFKFMKARIETQVDKDTNSAARATQEALSSAAKALSPSLPKILQASIQATQNV